MFESNALLLLLLLLLLLRVVCCVLLLWLLRVALWLLWLLWVCWLLWVWITNAVLIGIGALDGKELFAIQGSEKTGAQLRDNPEERENASKPPKSPSLRHMTASGNNVQIFKCELRREAGTTNTMKICEILPKAT